MSGNTTNCKSTGMAANDEKAFLADQQRKREYNAWLKEHRAEQAAVLAAVEEDFRAVEAAKARSVS